MQLQNFYRFNNVLNKNLTLLDWNNGDDRLPNHLDSQYCEHNSELTSYLYALDDIPLQIYII